MNNTATISASFGLKATENVEAGVHESTYALIVRSEERGRGILEAALYALVVLCAVVSFWEFSQQSLVIPASGISAATEIASTTVARTAGQSS